MSEQTSEGTEQQSTPEVDEHESSSQQAQTNEQDAPEADSDTSWDPERAKDKIRKINSENRALRERATEAERKAASVDELATANSTLATDNLRLTVGYELGLPMNLARRLQGGSREEMVADAESLVDLIAPTQRATPTGGRPTPALKPGATAEAIEPPPDDSYPAHWLPQRQQ